MKTRLLLLLAASTVFIFASCVKDEVVQTYKNYTPEEFSILQKSLNLPEDMHEYTLRLPDHLGGFPVHANDHQATLGRVLFYDKTLSSNGQISCASCHIAEKGFADNEAFSKGVSVSERTSRNSLGLASFPSFSNHYDSGNGGRLFWDERAGTVVEQSRQSLLNPVEMGVGHMSEVAEKVRQKDYYDVLFKKAFPNENFMSKEDQILTAIQAFVNSIGCTETKFDQQMKSVNNENAIFAGFTQEENLGKTLFMTHCESCHNLRNKAHFLSPVTVANNGLDMVSEDKGVGGITHRSEDMGVFKVPMLRNVALTAPYMHDGRFATLEKVIEHYSTGVKNHPNLHGDLKVGPNQAKNLNLSQQEKNALVAFLHTLTDQETIAHERFSDPFK